MAAGMHLVGVNRGVVEVVLLLEMQRIHVGAETDRLLARPLALQGADHAGGGQPAMNLDAPGLQLVCHDLGSALFLEGGLGMAMDVAADGGELGGGTGEEVGRETGHGGPSCPAGRLAATLPPRHATPTARNRPLRLACDRRRVWTRLAAGPSWVAEKGTSH